MTIDMGTPQARMATHYMREVKGIHKQPHAVEKLDGRDCWYFYYTLPQGELELEVFYIREIDDWEIAVTSFPAAI